MKQAIEIRITRVNKTSPALYRITSVFGLMDTFEHPWITTKEKVKHHLDTLINPKRNIPVIYD